MKRALLGMGLLAGLVGCGINEDVYNARVAELNKTKAALEEEKRSAAEAKKRCDEMQAKLDAENKALKDKLVSLGQDLSSTSANLDAAKKRMEEMARAQKAAEARAAQFRQMVAKFKSMIDAGKLQVEIRNGLMLVKLPDNILFDPGKTELKKEGQEAIKQVTTILSGIEGRKFQVTGHTDNIPIKKGKFASNWELSTARALEVVNLMMKSGMDAKRLSAAGYADTLPIGDNASDAGRKQNRRIEIVVVPNIEDLPPMEDVKS